MGSIAERWRDFSGENDWKGLLSHPLDNDFRRYIIHYGERIEALVDAFISEEKSDNYGRSRYAKKGFFGKVGLEKGNPYKYEVTNFIYAALELKSSLGTLVKPKDLMAYVAVATDEGKAVLGRRDILVVWRGTILNPELIKDEDYNLVSASEMLGTTNSPQVHSGWYSLYTGTNSDSPLTTISARDQIVAEIQKQVAAYKDEELSITFVGHSMGSAIATLNATDIVFNGYNKFPGQPDKAIPVTAFCLACPRVGDSDFSKVFAELTNLHVLRINNMGDHVPKNPFWYSDVGKELVINSAKSTFLKSPSSPLDSLFTAHQLEVHLHTVAGYQGEFKPFELVINRDIALLNKGGDYLDDKHRVVSSWWTEKNKSMVQKDDGTWELKDSEEDV